MSGHPAKRGVDRLHLVDRDARLGGQLGDQVRRKLPDGNPGLGLPDPYLAPGRVGDHGQARRGRRPHLEDQRRPQARRGRHVLAELLTCEEAVGRAEFPDSGGGQRPQQAVGEHGHDEDEGAQRQQQAGDRVGQLVPGASAERRAQDAPQR
jgi:hypothetical protein